MSHPARARHGNLVAGVGMTLATLAMLVVAGTSLAWMMDQAEQPRVSECVERVARERAVVDERDRRPARIDGDGDRPVRIRAVDVELGQQNRDVGDGRDQPGHR